MYYEPLCVCVCWCPSVRAGARGKHITRSTPDKTTEQSIYMKQISAWSWGKEKGQRIKDAEKTKLSLILSLWKMCLPKTSKASMFLWMFLCMCFTLKKQLLLMGNRFMKHFPTSFSTNTSHLCGEVKSIFYFSFNASSVQESGLFNSSHWVREVALRNITRNGTIALMVLCPSPDLE